MPERKEVIEILRKELPLLNSRYGVKSMGLFGSFARLEHTPESDIDILVEFEKPIGLKFVELAEYLESLLKSKIDLVSRSAIRPDRWKYIAEDLIYV